MQPKSRILVAARHIDKKKILVLDKKFQEDYDEYDQKGFYKSKGSGPARNMAWAHALDNGHKFEWTMDDNIRGFWRFNKNQKIRCTDATFFRCMEDFVDRYENIAMAGPHYLSFFPRKTKWTKPFYLNSRIYSCNLIRTDLPYRWRGRYNEDTDLSLRMLKDGWCTILFSAFLQEKMVTQAVKGGNTDEIYKDGTLNKSRMIVHMHPDCVKLSWKYGRWHHHADYDRFKQRPRLKKDTKIESGVNNYGMRVVRLS